MMIEEEKFLKERIGTNNPFKVPEGYFDNFAGMMMERIKEQQPSAQIRKIEVPFYRKVHFWLSAAAVALVMGLSGLLYVNNDANTIDESELIASQDSSVSDMYFDEAADYVMLDNTEIYACLMNE
jgi:hypothetical protein